jgi:aspartyl-tRNA(Asn)/glutamyl-tRNA(Gln) amidotransferase subunit A
MELNQLTIHELQEKIKNGETSAVKITESVFQRIDAVEERVHSYIRLLKEEALPLKLQAPHIL